MAEPEEMPEVQLRKQVLLLATLVVGATYAAGINPPGGVWQENGSGHKAGDTILLATRRGRYLAFYYGNLMALAVSVVVILLLLLKNLRRGFQLRVIMVLDLLGLMLPYIAGSSRDAYSTLYCTVLATALPLFVISLFCKVSWQEGREQLVDGAPLRHKERRKVLMLLATFMVVITYVAGLSSSSGYWGRIESKYKQGDDALVGLSPNAKSLSRVFFYCNTAAFMVSLSFVVQLVGKNMPMQPPLYTLVLVALIGLLVGYAGGTYRNTDTNVYVLCLIAAVFAYIAPVFLMINMTWWSRRSSSCVALWLRQFSSDATTSTTEAGDELEPAISTGESRKGKSLILLLAALTAYITYLAGLDPPGGVWLWPDDDRNGHHAGEPILLSMHPIRYKVFVYCNSSAFVLSLVAMLTIMVQKDKKIHTRLLVWMMLDMVVLLGAYAAGTWRGARSSISVVAMAGVVIISVIVYLLCVTTRRTDTDNARLLKKRHKRLVLVATVVATITYQAALSPAAGFQRQGDAAGSMLLLNKYPRQVWAFFWCNTVSFMATIALIIFFVSTNLYWRALRCYALYGCIVLALLCLMSANAAESLKHVETYAYMFVLLAIVVTVISVHTIKSRLFLLEKDGDEDMECSGIDGPATIPRPRPTLRPAHRPRQRIITVQETMYREVYTSHKRLMLIGILAAGATYQAGLNPPGGFWQEDTSHGEAGSPVMYDTSRRRYLAFFYSNSISFVVSVFVIIMQLQQIIWKHQPNNTRRLVLATKAALVLDLLGLVAAYVAGTTWELGNAIALVVMVLFCLAIHVALWILTLFSVTSSDGRTMSLRASSV